MDKKVSTVGALSTMSTIIGIGILSLNFIGPSLVWAGQLPSELIRQIISKRIEYKVVENIDRPELTKSPVFDLPPELLEKSYSYLSAHELKLANQANYMSHAIAQNVNRDRYLKKIKEIEKLEKIEKLLGDFIPLADPQKGSIAASAIPQELWVEVMQNNPSNFKEERYCPTTHKKVPVLKEDGETETIEMCSDFPVDSVQAKNEGNGLSDEEFITKLNQLYEDLGLDTRYRRATAEEFIWADTEGGRAPKEDNDELWKYATYHDISDKNPTQHPDQSPPLTSGEHQPHGVNAKMANKFGFRRSSLWEWTDNMSGASRVLVGGSWYGSPVDAVSGIRNELWPVSRSSFIGPARLVRTK